MAVLIQNLNRALFYSILTPGNKISFLGSYQKALSRCCNDPLRPLGLSVTGNQPHSLFGGKSNNFIPGVSLSCFAWARIRLGCARFLSST
jgi:hypothetical protein